MDSGAALSRAVMTAGVWAGASWVLSMVSGVEASMGSLLMDGASMGGASLVSDTIHATLSMRPTGTTAALATGASFAGIRRLVSGDENYGFNVLAGAGADMLTERVLLASGM